MKTTLFIVALLISTITFGQSKTFSYDSLSRTSKFIDGNGHVINEIIELDKEKGKQEHFISYAKNGQKTEEFFMKNGVTYDTLKRLTDKGELHHVEIYTDSGYTSIDYWYDTGRILEIGEYKISKTSPKNITVYDSTSFNKYTTAECKIPCYLRNGRWNTFHENGIIESEGEYLPMDFRVAYPTKDSSAVALVLENTSFEMIPDVSYVICLTFLKNGHWIYYDTKGVMTKEEFYKNGLLQK
jgi:antitoxin component YwqK of YwqJK toxin-antitoxin module